MTQKRKRTPLDLTPLEADCLLQLAEEASFDTFENSPSRREQANRYNAGMRALEKLRSATRA